MAHQLKVLEFTFVAAAEGGVGIYETLDAESVLVFSGNIEEATKYINGRFASIMVPPGTAQRPRVMGPPPPAEDQPRVFRDSLSPDSPEERKIESIRSRALHPRAIDGVGSSGTQSMSAEALDEIEARR